MVTVTTEELAKNLTQYLDKAQHGERVLVKDGTRTLAVLSPASSLDEARDQAEVLAQLAAEGTVVLPSRQIDPRAPRPPLVPSRGRLASEIVVEDRS
jgi:antitoxin (DNA-binding transcriptional repressor) of toxin-antitoxin stability system